MQSAPSPSGGAARSDVTPSPSISTASPRSTSRTKSAPTRSSAHVSDAATQSSPIRPRQSGRIPRGSRKAIKPVLRERDAREGAVELRDRARDGVLERRVVVGDQRRDHLAVGGRVDADAARRKLLAQLSGVRQVAVVAERDRPRAAVVHDRLGVRPVRRAGRRVARVPDRELAAKTLELLLGEHLRHEPHLAERR